MGWVGTLFLIMGFVLGGKRRYAILLSMLGELIWAIRALERNMYDLAVNCIFFTLVLLRSWIKWKP